MPSVFPELRNMYCRPKFFEKVAMRQVRSNPLEGAKKLPFAMKDTRWSAKDGWGHEPIDVVVMHDGNFTTIDNTRVLAARYAEIVVQANVYTFDELLLQDIDLNERFTTLNGVPKTWGDAILLRIGKQNSGYRNTYPLESNIIGWSGN